MQKKVRLIRKVKLPEVLDDCFLYFAQAKDRIPFSIKRVYYILHTKTKLPRGLHAHKKNKQVIFCIQGSIKLILDNGRKKEEIILDKPNVGIFLDKLIWHEMHNFKKNTILLVLASMIFDEKDYIRDYEKFINETESVVKMQTNGKIKSTKKTKRNNRDSSDTTAILVEP